MEENINEEIIINSTESNKIDKEEIFELLIGCNMEEIETLKTELSNVIQNTTRKIIEIKNKINSSMKKI